jgi:hypothetical protein
MARLAPGGRTDGNRFTDRATLRPAGFESPGEGADLLDQREMLQFR